MSDPIGSSASPDTKKEESEMDESASVVSDPCPVCLSGRISESAIDGCPHTFCYSCITEWLKVSESCPLCKAPVTEIRTNVDGVQKVKKISELKAEAEAARIIAQANEIPMTSEREAVAQLIHQQRAVVQQLIATKARHKNSKTLNEGYRRETSRLTRFTALKEEMDRIPRREIMGDARFREVVYSMQLVWKEINRPSTAIRFNPSMACSDPDALMQRLRPFLMRELKIIMIDNKKLNERVLSVILTSIQNHEINNPNYELVLLNTGLFNAGYISLFAHLLYEFCASGLDLEAFDANSTYSMNPERAPSGRLIPSLLPSSSRTSDPQVFDVEDDEEDDDAVIIDGHRSDSSSSDGVAELYNHPSCRLYPSIPKSSPLRRDTRSLHERLSSFIPNVISNRINGRLRSHHGFRSAPRAPEVISLEDDSSARDEARINVINRRDREVAEPSWLTGISGPSDMFSFGARLNPIGFSLPESVSDRRERGGAGDMRKNGREIETSWKAEKERRNNERKDKRKGEKERKKDRQLMGVKMGSRRNTTQYFYDKLHDEALSTPDLQRLNGELAAFSDRINYLKEMCSNKLSEKMSSDGASSSNGNSQNGGVVVVEDDEDVIQMQEDGPGTSQNTQDDSVLIL